MNEQILFTAALECESADDRAIYLEQACPDVEMRIRVQHLLEVYFRAGDFLAKPAIEAPSDSLAENVEGVGQTIGPYKLLEQIGEGGMGVVYHAAQQSPVKRKVALKIIKPGMDTKQVIARFEAERQALALMDHPNIAHVLDAGSTASGRPYFVMELVRGIPVTDYCQREKLSVRQRLLLFINICQAVQHAHLKGIIHRDIKPSNVMVTLHDGVPVTKMIDFGVAKATNQQLTDRTLFTNFAQFIGTPLYMSPEQAEMSGLDVDTRSDIYSLGVLLYELLTATTPFEESRLKEVGYDEMRRIIREEEPPKPSSRVSTENAALETISDQRNADAKRVLQALRGEVDWIVVRALEKQRERRYQSAKDFADDVQRYLDGEPVEACPPSVVYRAKKLLAKYRGAVVTGVAAAILLVVTATVSTLFAIRANQAEKDAAAARSVAETEAAIANAITRFLSEDLLGQASPNQNANRDIRLRELLDRASERIDDAFDGPPLVEAAIRMTLGTTYIDLGEYEPAEEHLKHAFHLRRNELGPTHEDTLKTAFQLGVVELSTASRDSATKMFKKTLDLQREHLGDDHADTLLTMDWLAYCYTLQRRFDMAEPLAQEALAGMRRVLGSEHPDTLDCLDSTAKLLQYQQRYDEAEQLNTQLLEMRRKVLTENHPQYIDSLASLAAVKIAQGETDIGIKLYGDVVAARRRIQGDTHPGTLSDAKHMAHALHSARRFASAEELYLDTLAAQRRRYGDNDIRTFSTMRSLAGIYIARERFLEAEEMLQSALATRNGDDQMTVSLLQQLAKLQASRNSYDDACKLHEQAIKILADLPDRTNRQWLLARSTYVHTLSAAKRFDEAERLANKLLTEQRKVSGNASPEVMQCLMQLGFIQKKQLKWAEAARIFDQAWRESPAILSPEHSETLRAGNQLAEALSELGRVEQAEVICRQVLKARRESLKNDHVDIVYSLAAMAKICERLERYEEAAEFYAQTVQFWRNRNGDDSSQSLTAVTRLRKLQTSLEERGAAEQAATIQRRVEAIEADFETTAAAIPDERDRLFASAKIKSSLGKLDEAVALYKTFAAAKLETYDKRVGELAHYLLHPARSSNRLDLAELLMRDAVDRQVVAHGQDAYETLNSRLQLAFAVRMQGKLDEAEELFWNVWTNGPSVFGPTDARTLRAGSQLADILARDGRLDEAEPLCRRVLTTREKTLGPDSYDVLISLKTLNEIRRRQMQYDEMCSLTERCVQIQRKISGDNHPKTLAQVKELENLAAYHRKREDLSAEIYVREVVDKLHRELLGKGSPESLNSMGRLARAYERAEEWQKLFETRSQELAIRRAPGVQDHTPCYCMHLNGDVLVRLERYADAEDMLRDTINAWEESDPTNNLKYLTYRLLGEVLTIQGNFRDAESMLLICHKAWEDKPKKTSRFYPILLERLVALYQASGQAEEEARWKAELQALTALKAEAK